MTTTPRSKYADLSSEQLIQLLEKRDGERKLGLIWERDHLEAEKAVNNDFVALQFAPEHSVGPAPYQNLIMEGDNYDVLRYLNIAYRGRIKCIYIDPPYNTGNKDFIYNDNFLDKEHRYRHSTWLEFMHRRLTLARDLLAEDGVLFISISEHEHARLELLCDEIFPRMKVANFVWRTRSGANDEKDWFVSVDHEYVLCYANPGFSFAGNTKALADYSNPDNDPRGNWMNDNLTGPKNYLQRPNSFFPIQNPENQVWYPCDPDRVWAFASRNTNTVQKLRGKPLEEMIEDHRVLWKPEPDPAHYDTEEALQEAVENGSAPANMRVYQQQRLAQLRAQVGAGEAPRKLLESMPPLAFWVGKKIGFTKPRLKRFASELKRTEQPVSTWVLPSAVKKADVDNLEGLEAITLLKSGYTSDGTTLLRQMIGQSSFAFPKPLSLIKSLIAQATDAKNGDIVLDFFAGSGTTGHAVLALNAEDDGDRQFLLVSSTEATPNTPKLNVCRDITAQRIRAAIQGYEYASRNGRQYAEGLGGEFGYLITERLPLERLHAEIRHDQVWLALQQMHGLGVVAYNASESMQILESERERLIYLPSVTQNGLSELADRLQVDAKSTVVYSPAPGQLEGRLFGENVAFERIPEVLLERFAGHV